LDNFNSNPTLPSTYYPDYFKVDLGFGTDRCAPLAQTFDDTWSSWTDASGLAALSIQPALFCSERERLALTSWGFVVDNLTGDEVHSFYSLAHTLMASRDTLNAVERLAQIHFGESLSHVRRGRPERVSRLEGKMGFPLQLSDDQSRSTCLHVRLSRIPSADRVNVFISNTKALVPTPFHVLVSVPCGPITPPTPFRLGRAKPFFSRRL
jgi:hypothetical protein